MTKSVNNWIFSLISIGMLFIFINSCTKNENENVIRYGENLIDLDSNVYRTVIIGKQVWMAENLKTTKYRDGTSIPNITNDDAWSKLKTGAYCNNIYPSANPDVYGRLYNWYAVTDARCIAPKGWHVPTNSEWYTLTNYLGNDEAALKETGTVHWTAPNKGATNKTGFTALPGGARLNFGNCYPLGELAYWWSSSEYDSTHAWSRFMDFMYPIGLYDRYLDKKEYGYSVRCIKD